MKRLIYLLIICIPFFLKGQSTIVIGATENGNPIAIGMHEVRIAIADASGGTIIRDAYELRRIFVDEDLDDLFNDGDCNLIKMTRSSNNQVIGVNPRYITKVGTGGEGTYVQLREPRQTYIVTEAVQTMIDRVTACIGNASTRVNDTYYVHGEYGNDTTGVRGSPLMPYQTIHGLRDTMVADSVDGFVYIYSDTINLTNETRNLGAEGRHLRYYFEPGSVVIDSTMTSANNPLNLGSGALTDSVTTPTTFEILGDGEFHAIDGAGLNIFLGTIMEGSDYRFQGKKVVVTGADGWAFSSRGVNCHIEVDEIHTQGLAYSSATNVSTWELNHYFKANKIVQDSNAVRGGCLRMQYQDFYYPGSSSVIEVDSWVGKSGNTKGDCFNIQSNEGGTQGNFIAKFGTIRNYRTGTKTYPDFEDSSNNTDGSELHLSGGQTQYHIHSQINISAESIISNQPANLINGIHLDSSHVVVDVGKAITNGSISHGLFGPRVQNYSTITVRGEFINNTTNQPAAMLTVDVSDSTSYIIYDRVRFVANAPGEACIQITNKSKDHNLIFDNCTFINDGTVAPVQVEGPAKKYIRFYNCVTNSAVVDTNLVELVDTIRVDTQML